MSSTGKVKPLQSDVAFSDLQFFGNKCSDIFFDRKLNRFLDLEQNFPEQIQKTVIIVLLRNVLKSS